MPDWKKLIEGKIALALKAKASGNQPSKPSEVFVRLPGKNVYQTFLF